MATNANPSKNWRSARARIAGLSASPNRPPDDLELIEARRDLKEIRLQDYIDSVLSSAPPLTSEQRARLAELLAPTLQKGAG